MNAKQLALIGGLAAFTALTGYALWAQGFVGSMSWFASTPAGWQAVADVCVLAAVAAGFIHRDAKTRGLNPWPWIALCATGSFGPLAYLIWRSAQEDADDPAQSHSQLSLS